LSSFNPFTQIKTGFINRKKRAESDELRMSSWLFMMKIPLFTQIPDSILWVLQDKPHLCQSAHFLTHPRYFMHKYIWGMVFDVIIQCILLLYKIISYLTRISLYFFLVKKNYASFSNVFFKILIINQKTYTYI
jgi:hypothetical protein